MHTSVHSGLLSGAGNAPEWMYDCSSCAGNASWLAPLLLCRYPAALQRPSTLLHSDSRNAGRSRGLHSPSDPITSTCTDTNGNTVVFGCDYLYAQA